jgi:RHS repeat-associated protein
VVDLDGDGSPDFVKQYANAESALASRSSFADHLGFVDNGAGGTVALEYASAVQQKDSTPQGLEWAAEGDAGLHQESDTNAWTVWGSVSVVASVTTTDVDGRSFETSMRYAYPRYSPSDRSFLGFRLVETVLPDVGSPPVPDGKTLTYFRQRHGIAGEMHLQQTFDGAGVLVAEVERDLTVLDGDEPVVGAGSTDGASVGRLTAEREYHCYGEGKCVLRRGATYTFSTGVEPGGYNFISKIQIERESTGILTVDRVGTPADLVNWIVGRVDNEKVYDASFEYQSVRYQYWPSTSAVSRVERDVRARTVGGTGGDVAVTEVTFDGFGNLRSRMDPGGRLEYFCYDGDSSFSGGGTCPVPGGGTHTVLTGIKDKLGEVTAYISDLATGQVRDVTRWNGDRAWHVPDAFGRPLQSYVDPLGSIGATLVESRAYFDDPASPAGRPFTERFRWTEASPNPESVRSAEYTDGLGRVSWSVAQGPAGWFGRSVVRDYAGREVAATYDRDCGQDPHCLGLEGAPNPDVLSTYDVLGRLLVKKERESAGFAIEAAAYGMAAPFDRVLTKDPRGNLTERWLDGDRVVRVRECTNGVSEAQEELSGVSCAGGSPETEYAFAGTGEITTIYDAIGSGNHGNPRHRLEYRYDTLGRTIEILDPDARIPGGHGTLTTYDLAGTVHSVTNARDQETIFTYDALDRLTDVDRPDDLPPGFAESDFTITYDPHTRQRASSSAVDGSYSQQFFYDEFGRLRQQNLTIGGTTLRVDTTYDLLGRPKEVKSPFSGTSLLYQYTGAYLEAVCEPLFSPATDCQSSSYIYLNDVAYDAIGRVSNVISQPGNLSYSYHPQSYRLENMTLATGGGDLLNLTYQHDLAGNVTQVTDAHTGMATDGIDATANYSYDGRNRLLSWTLAGEPTEFFNYDSIGNVIGKRTLSAPATNQFYEHPDKPHAITGFTAGVTDFEYDLDGNTVRRRKGDGGTTQFLTFDSANRLRRVGTSVGSSDIAAFFYDADGTRLLETTGDVQTVFLGEGFELVAVQGANPKGLVHVNALGRRIATKTIDNPILRSAWAPLSWIPHAERPTVVRGVTATLLAGLLLALLGLGLVSAARARPLRTAVGLLALVCFVAPGEALAGGGGGGGTAKRRFYFGDHLGSSALVTDKTGGVIERTTFEPFGLVADHYPIPATESNERLFTGRRYEEASDLHDFRARWYDAHTGRFLSVDPIIQQPADPQTLNAYGYVRNNPVNNVDPTGLGFFKKLGKWLKALLIPTKDSLKAVGIGALALIPYIGPVLAIAYSAYRFARNPTWQSGAALAASVYFAGRGYWMSFGGGASLVGATGGGALAGPRALERGIDLSSLAVGLAAAAATKNEGGEASSQGRLNAADRYHESESGVDTLRGVRDAIMRDPRRSSGEFVFEIHHDLERRTYWSSDPTGRYRPCDPLGCGSMPARRSDDVVLYGHSHPTNPFPSDPDRLKIQELGRAGVLIGGDGGIRIYNDRVGPFTIDGPLLPGEWRP